MPTLDDLNNEIHEFDEKYRSGNLNLSPSPIYDLHKDQSNNQGAEPGWPDTWPNNGKRGIYAILSGNEVLYIGKASLGPIGGRLGSYFRYGP